MATMVNIHEAKTHLSKLVERAANDEEIIIAKAGKPMARLRCSGRSLKKARRDVDSAVQGASSQTLK